MPRLNFKNIAISLLLIGVLSSIAMPIQTSAQSRTDDESTSFSDKLELLDDSLADLFDSNNIFPGFDDLFAQNTCKRQDLIALIKRRDGYGALARKAVLESEATVLDIRKYLALWELSSAELYFLRNLETLAEASGSAILQKETLDLYPDNPLITRDTVANFLSYYQARQTDYDNCAYSFRDLARQWNQMQSKWRNGGNNFGAALDELGASADAFWQDLKQRTGRAFNNVVAIFDPQTEFQAGDFLEFNTDLGPYDQYLNQSKNKINKVTELIDDAELTAISNNSDLISVLGNAARNVDQKYTLLESELDLGNSYLEYNYADFVVASIWAQAGNTKENLENLASSVDPDNKNSITQKLDQANERQCRLPEK